MEQTNMNSFKVPLSQTPRNTANAVNDLKILENDIKQDFIPQSLNSMVKILSEHSDTSYEENMHEDIYSDEGSNSEENEDASFRPASRSNYSTTVTKILRKWFEKHIDNPYPSEEEERVKICEQTGLTRKQLRVWFINSRKRKLTKVTTKKHKSNKASGDVKLRKQHKLECDIISEASSNQNYNPEILQQSEDSINQKIPIMNLMLKYHIYLNRESMFKMNNFVNQIQKYCFCDLIEFGIVKNQSQINTKYQ